MQAKEQLILTAVVDLVRTVCQVVLRLSFVEFTEVPIGSEFHVYE